MIVIRTIRIWEHNKEALLILGDQRRPFSRKRQADWGSKNDRNWSRKGTGETIPDESHCVRPGWGKELSNPGNWKLAVLVRVWWVRGMGGRDEAWEVETGMRHMLRNLKRSDVIWSGYSWEVLVIVWIWLKCGLAKVLGDSNHLLSLATICYHFPNLVPT